MVLAHTCSLCDGITHHADDPYLIFAFAGDGLHVVVHCCYVCVWSDVSVALVMLPLIRGIVPPSRTHRASACPICMIEGGGDLRVCSHDPARPLGHHFDGSVSGLPSGCQGVISSSLSACRQRCGQGAETPSGGWLGL